MRASRKLRLMVSSVFLLLLLLASDASTECGKANNFLDQISAMPTANWGFIDKTGKLVIAAKFEDVGVVELLQRRFSEGLCAVKTQGKWGYIDHHGKFAIEPRFDDADAFHEGLAYVSDGSIQGYINQKGKLLIKLQSLPVSPWVGTAHGDFGNGREFHDGRAPVRLQQHRFGFIDRSGKRVIEAKYSFVLPFSEGLAAVRSSSTPFWGYVDVNGKEVIAPKFRSAQSFHDGVAIVATAGKPRSPLDARYSNAVIDKTGKFVFDCSGKMCDPTFFAAGLTTAEIYSARWRDSVGDHSLNRWGVVDKTGRVLFQLPAPAGRYCEGLSAVADDTHHIGYIDRTGKWLIKPQFDFPSLEFSEGLAVASKNGKTGYIDKSGKFTIAPAYSSSTSQHPQPFYEGLAAVPILAPEKGN